MKISVLDGAIINPGDVSWQPIKNLGEVMLHDETEPCELPGRVANADVVIVNKTIIDKNAVDALQCKLLCVLATGTNNLDLDCLAKKQIQACNVPAYGVEDVAQHGLALIMELCRNIGIHSADIKNGGWKNTWCYWLKTPVSLKGLTLGIIGFGAIGQMMGKYGNALGMNILASSRTCNAHAEYPFRYADLDTLLANSDIISLHCPLTEKTDKIINDKNIDKMKKGAIIINTSRGGLVDEYAAANALKSGKLGGLGTDVLSCEPASPDNPLLSAPNVLITPHIAWATANARQKIIDITAENIQAFFSGNVKNAVNTI